MQTKKFGLFSDQIPVIGQGTWKTPLRSEKGWDDAVQALRSGVGLDLTHIDTAEMYGSGQAEELVGEAIKGLPRDDLFIVSKVLPNNASYKGTIRACENSLKRIKLDHLDCYLLHWRGSHPLEETMGALEQLVKEGKIRSLGVSNFDVDDLEEAARHLSREKIYCNQVLYNLEHRGIERKLIPYCQEKSISIVGYTPFGQRPVPAATQGAGSVLHKVAKAHGATVRQVMLAFLVRLPGTFTIPKASNLEHLKDNARAGALTLTTDDIAALDEAFPIPSRDVPLAMI